MFEKIVNSPWVTLASGLILTISSGYEVYSEIAHARLGAHHGVFVYGLLMILRSIPDFQHAFQKVDEGIVGEEKSSVVRR